MKLEWEWRIEHDELMSLLNMGVSHDPIVHVTPSTSPPGEGALVRKGGVGGTRAQRGVDQAIQYIGQGPRLAVHVPPDNDDGNWKSQDGGGI